MTYRQGQIFCGPNGSNGAGGINVVWAFINTIGADMVNTGWVKVTSQNVIGNCMSNAITAPNGTIGPNSTVYNVYQSPGKNNSIGNTFYLALGTDVQTNTRLVVCGPFMTWNTNPVGGNLAQNYIPGNSNVSFSGATSVAANGFCINTSAFGGNVLSTLEESYNVNVMYMATLGGIGRPGGPFSNTPNTMGTGYYYSVTIDRVILSVANLTPGCVQGYPQQTYVGQPANRVAPVWYFGVYDTVLPAYINPNPLIAMNVYSVQNIYKPGGTGESGGGGIVFECHAGAGGGTMWSPIVSNGLWGLPYTVGGNGQLGDVDAGGPLAITPGRVLLYCRGSGGFQIGGVLGFFKDLYWFGVNAPTFSGRGDTGAMVLDGITYGLTNIGDGISTFITAGGYQQACYGPWLLQR